MAEPRTRRRVIVHGRVQGVVFRGTTQEQAERAGVDGWVRNRRDGSVEAVFEGAPADVAALVQFCQHGPSWAAVARVEVVEEVPEGLCGFRIR